MKILKRKPAKTVVTLEIDTDEARQLLEDIEALRSKYAMATRALADERYVHRHQHVGQRVPPGARANSDALAETEAMWAGERVHRAKKMLWKIVDG